jgi:hypothetical protein
LPLALGLERVDAIPQHLILDFRLEVIPVQERALIQLWKDIQDHATKVKVTKLAVVLVEECGQVNVKLGARVIWCLLRNVLNRFYSNRFRVLFLPVASAIDLVNQSEAFLVNEGFRKYWSRIGGWCMQEGGGGILRNKSVKLHGRRASFERLLDLLGQRFGRRHLLFDRSRLCGWLSRNLSLFQLLWYNR